MNYYNENDASAAAWLRALIKNQLIPNGYVDERSIEHVRARDLSGYTQCHFFAGVGGWAYALVLAGWNSNSPVWTGSCPCQPFSDENVVWKRGGGFSDERDLWPCWHRLVEECRPATVFGEEVADAVACGWLDRTFADLEGSGYACGSAILPAISVGAPHKRDRLWFVGHSQEIGRKRLSLASPDVRKNGRFNPWRSTARTGTSYRGKKWLTEPGIRPLVNGLPGSVDTRCGFFGNAIVPQVAARFIQASI